MLHWGKADGSCAPKGHPRLWTFRAINADFLQCPFGALRTPLVQILRDNAIAPVGE